MIDIILILAYIACCIASYFIFKNSWLQECKTNKWNAGDRAIFGACSIMGPLSFGLALFYLWTVKSHY